VTKLTDEEENVRRRFAVALGSIPLDDYKVMHLTVLRDGAAIDLRESDANPGWWTALHDHDPDDHEGHVTISDGETPEAALAECLRELKAWESANPEE